MPTCASESSYARNPTPCECPAGYDSAVPLWSSAPAGTLVFHLASLCAAAFAPTCCQLGSAPCAGNAYYVVCDSDPCPPAPPCYLPLPPPPSPPPSPVPSHIAASVLTVLARAAPGEALSAGGVPIQTAIAQQSPLVHMHTHMHTHTHMPIRNCRHAHAHVHTHTSTSTSTRS